VKYLACCECSNKSSILGRGLPILEGDVVQSFEVYTHLPSPILLGYYDDR
jgi:hypothetical protein